MDKHYEMALIHKWFPAKSSAKIDILVWHITVLQLSPRSSWAI